MKCKSNQTLRMIALVAGLLTASTLSSHAVIYSWTNTTSGTYSDANNWDPNSGFPVSGDEALFLQSGSYAVNFTASAAASNVVMRGSSAVTWNMGANTYLGDIPSPQPNPSYRFFVGTNNADSVTFIQNGGTIDLERGQTYFGMMVGNNSTLIISNGAHFRAAAMGFGSTAAGAFGTNSQVFIDGAGTTARLGVHDLNQFQNTFADVTVKNGASARLSGW